MSDGTKVYISVESHDGHLVIDGPMALCRELVGSLTTARAPTALAYDDEAAERQPEPVA
jgi:hypothetical protein